MTRLRPLSEQTNTLFEYFTIDVNDATVYLIHLVYYATTMYLQYQLVLKAVSHNSLSQEWGCEVPASHTTPNVIEKLRYHLQLLL